METANHKIIHHELGGEDLMSTATSLSIIIAIVITVFNKFVLPLIIHKIVDKEKHITKTNLNISYAIKLAIVNSF